MQTNDIIDFLTELNENNNREWFAENKARFDACRKYFDGVATDLIAKISEFDADIKSVQASECVFRIYRDIRFSHDKTPYKTHFGVYIASQGGRKSQRGGYYLHLDPAGCFMAVGVWCPPPHILKALRQSVCDNIDELNEIRTEKAFAANFNSFYEEDKLKTVPKGFPKDFEEPELLKLKHYMVEHKLDDSILKSTDFVDKVVELCKAGYPLNRFLNYTVDEMI